MALTRHLTTPPELVRPELSSRSAGRRRHFNQWGALAAISIATFVVVTDFMAVGVALPTVQKGLGASFPQLQWVVEAFVVPLAAGVLAAGHATVRFGSRSVLLTGLSALAGGSLLAALSSSAYVLIGGRVIQGLGGALVLATGASILADGFNEANGRIGVTVWGAATGLGVGLSPLLGSFIVGRLGWRWVFGLAGVASFLAFAIAYRAVGARWRDERVNTPSDWRGLTLFGLGTAILVIGLIRTTSTLGGWAQSGVLACFACSGLLLATFVAVEAVSPHPLLDVSLFRKRTVAGSAVAAFGLSAAVFGPFIFLVLFLSYDRGYSTQSIGVHLFLLSGATLALLPLAGLLDRHLPAKLVICSGLVLVGVGLWLMSRVVGSAGWEDLVPGLVTAGVGLELVNPRLASTAAAAAGPEEHSALAASRTNTTMRQLGAAIGVAVLGSVFATRLSDELSSRLSVFSQLSGQGPQVAGLVLEGHRAAALSAVPAGVRPVLLSAVQTSVSAAMHEVLLAASAVGVLSGLLALSIRSSDVPRQKRARQEVQTVPALASTNRTELIAGSRPRAQLVPGPTVRGEGQAAEVVLAPVVHAGVVRDEPSTSVGRSSGDEVPTTTVPKEHDELSDAEVPQVGVAPLSGAGDSAPPVASGSLAVSVSRAGDGLPLKAELKVVGPAAVLIARYWTGVDGELLVAGLAPGKYELVVQKLGYRPETVAVEVTGGGTEAVQVAMVGMAHIYGAVEGPGGGWLPGILLTLTDSTDRVVAITKTDAAGSYHFSRVPEGSYTVAAPAYLGATSLVNIGAGSAVAADVVFGTSPAGEPG
jgi:predicted MFS family arabinose efflux permease